MSLRFLLSMVLLMTKSYINIGLEFPYKYMLNEMANKLGMSQQKVIKLLIHNSYCSYLSDQKKFIKENEEKNG